MVKMSQGKINSNHRIEQGGSYERERIICLCCGVNYGDYVCAVTLRIDSRGIFYANQ